MRFIQNTRLLLMPLMTGAVALALSAGEGWINKDYSQWSDQEVQKVLNNSPWAQKTSVMADSPSPGGRGGRGGPGGGGGAGGPGGGGGGGGMGGGGLNGGSVARPRNAGADETQSQGPPRIEVLVRWESALPLKEARLREQFGEKLPHPGDANYTLDQADKDYIISVSGLHGAGSRNPAGDMRDSLRSSTQLLIKGKDGIAPEDVKFDTGRDGYTIRFLFPRTAPIDLDDKEVTFQTAIGRMKIDRKFKLKDMVLNGKLAL